VRVYQFQFPKDGRAAIFEVWKERDMEAVVQVAKGGFEILCDTGSDNNIEISEGVLPEGVPQQNDEVGTSGGDKRPRTVAGKAFRAIDP
jgi:hypothetical protein